MGFAYLLEMKERSITCKYARPGAVLYALHAIQVIGIAFPSAIFQIIMDAELREEEARKKWAYCRPQESSRRQNNVPLWT
ncbi:MAG TPA: hypothetical protein VGO47_03090, partial [Chlamydiales bacterium]|nr:hypothetical protein [Chlamydiales bacterium]